MKQYLPNVCILFVCISGTLLLPQRSYGQLSGSYTINPTKAASSSNYKNWASAVGDLISGTRTDGGTVKGPGVSGAVTFTVYDTLYSNTNVAITAITGASSTKRITFKSAKGDSIKCKIQYPSGTTNTDDYALLLDGADFITFQQIGFERTGTNAFSTVVQITNDADNNKFIRCQMTGLKIINATVFDIGDGSCILLSGNADSTEITGCRLLYGFNGIYTATASAGIKISGNTIDTSGSSGAMLKNQTGLKIIGNNVNLGDFGSNSGQYTSYGFRIETSASFEISKNKIFSMAVNAGVSRSIILFTCVSTSSAPALVTNNFILNYGGLSANGCNGLACYGCNYVNFYYNNVLITNAATDGSAYFHQTGYTSTFVNLKNNNFINKGGGFAINIPTADLDSVNFNNLYVSGKNLTTWNATAYSSLSSWQTGTGKDANSLNLDPGYLSSSNLHISNYSLKAKGTPYYRIKDDIDGDLRDANAPDIGADELKPLANDAAMITLTKPVAGVCVGTLSVEGVIKNFGTSPLKKATITWSVNGVAQTPYNWTGNLNINKTDTVVVGSFNFIATPNPKIVLKSTVPNGVSDTAAYNDSIIVVRALKAPPTANAGADFVLCLGDSATIGPANNPTYTYKWMDMSGSTIGTTSQIKVKPTVKTSYAMEVKSIAFGCTNRDTITLTVNSKPVADAGPDFSICLGQSAQIGKASQNGFTYSWTSQPSGFTSSLANPTVIPSVTTNYTLEKTITATGCKATDIAKVTVNLPPTPLITGIKAPCNNTKPNYITNANTGSSYKWKVVGGFGLILSGQNSNNVKVWWTVADTSYLQVKETNASGCSDSTTYMVIVNPEPVADFSFTDSTCKGITTIFKDKSIDALTTVWNFGDGGSSVLPSPTHTYANEGFFTVKLAVQNSFGCPDTAWGYLNIFPLPVAAFGITKSGEKKFDFKDSSTISLGTITAWHWNFGNSDTSILQNPTYQYTLDGNMAVELCVTSSAGCKNCFSKNLNIVNLFEPSYSNKLFCVPNPGSGIFKITSLTAVRSVVITNLTGQVIETLNPLTSVFNIDLSQQPNGIYFVNVMTDQQGQVIKLIKQ